MDLSPDIAIVTGASSGLGRRFAEVLAANGAYVVCAARRADRLSELVGKIEAAGGRAAAVSFDAEASDACEALVKAAETLAGTPSILVNNAGMSTAGRAQDISCEDYDRTMTVNVKAPWHLSQLCARPWIASTQNSKANALRIVNIASIAGWRTVPGASVYAMSKAAVVHMTHGHAREWARYGIRVNALCPGYFRTELNDTYWDSPAGQADFARLPRRRLGTPEQLDKALLFLVDPENDFTNGASLAVDDAQSQVL